MYTQEQIDDQVSREPKYRAIAWVGFGLFFLSGAFIDYDPNINSNTLTTNQWLLLLAGFVWYIVWLSIHAYSKSEKMKYQNKKEALDNWINEYDRKREEDERKKQALVDAKDTLWRAVDPTVDPADRPTPEEVQKAQAFIMSMKNT